MRITDPLLLSFEQAADRSVEFFRLSTAEELKRRLTRRAKRKREKERSAEAAPEAAPEAADAIEVVQRLEDECVPLGAAKMSSKIRSVAFAPASLPGGVLKVGGAAANASPGCVVRLAFL